MTQSLAIVGLYAALNTLILFWFDVATGKLRAKHKVSIGDGGVKHLIRILRGHANAIENMPMFFILMAIAAMLAAPNWLLHGLGLVFTVARAIHAWHFIQEDAPGWQRAAGFGLSALALLLVALGVLGHGLAAMG
ncbi:MAG: MAPEG family protein [Phyllobacteriaceae bacterium]|nr:MAPEG family protein [Phyllobacteriaceae bacterium]